MKNASAHEGKFRRAFRRLKPHGIRLRKKHDRTSTGSQAGEKNSHQD